MAVKSSWFQTVVVAVACLAVICGSIAAAPEAMAKGPKAKNKHQAWSRFGFGDVDAGKYGWALEGLTSMKAKGIVKGYDDGTFRPEAPITETEALAMALRLLGLEEEAQEKAKAQVPVVAGVPAWARGYVVLGSELGLVRQTELKAMSPASRLWIAVLLVKALDLEADSDDVEEELDRLFADAADVPAAWRGYLAVAAKKGLLSGYPDRTFRPNQPITRAEMATILDRIDQNMPWIWKYEVRGRVVSVGDDEITVAPWWRWLPEPVVDLPLQIPERVRARLRARYQVGATPGSSAGGFEWEFTGGAGTSLGIGGNCWMPLPAIRLAQAVQPKTYKVSEDALMLVNGQEGSLEDISPGDDVRMVLNSEGVAILIIARSGMWWDIRGTVIDIEDDPEEITVQTSVYGETTYRAADSVRVEYQGKEVEWSDIRVGDQVSLRLYEGKVIHVKILPRTVVVHGTIRDLPSGDSQRIQVVPESGAKVTYAVDDDTEVRYRGKDIEIADLKVGDKVKLVVERGTVTLIELKTPVGGREVGEEDEEEEDEEERETERLSATITAVHRTASRTVLAVRTGEGKTKRYELASDCRIELEDGSIYVGEIRPGDKVTLALSGNVVTRLVLRSR